MIPNDFHFERPLWLLAAIPAALVLWSAVRAGVRTSAWRNAVDAHLLRHLLLPGNAQKNSSWLWLLGLGWLAAILAMAGPSWERVPQPTTKTIEPTVVALEMSPSMDSTDLTPSRLARARYKLQDVLQRSAGGQVALVIYSDEPFVVSPLTDDARVIQEMIPTLESSLMPGQGNRADRAIEQSLALLEQAGAPGGRILLFADSPGDNPELTRQAAARAASQGRELSVLGVGTEEGAGVRSPVVPSELEAIAAAGGGRFALLTPSGSDLDALLAMPRSATSSHNSDASISADVEMWRDAGVYLLFIPVLLAPLAFRRGWLAVVALAVLLGGSDDAEASFWQDLWQTRDQQAATAFQSGDAAQAAELFESPDWKAAAQYESGQFDQAIGAYGALEGGENRYNQGNALAKAGKLEEAVQAYDEVLEKQDDHDDARFNRDLVKKLLEEQKQQQQQQQNQDQQGGEGEQKDQQQSGSEGSQDQQESQQGQGDESKENQSAEQQGAQGSGQAQSEEQKQESQSAQQAKAEESSADEKQQQSAGAEPKDDSSEQQAKAQQAKASDKKDDSLSEQLSKALDAQEQTEPAKEEKDEQGTQVSGSSKKPITEEQQAREQKLRQIPDDPGGLLRAKIHRRYAEKRYSQGGVSPW